MKQEERFQLHFFGNQNNTLMSFVSLSTSDNTKDKSKLRRVNYYVENDNLIRQTTLPNNHAVVLSKRILLKDIDNYQILFGEDLNLLDEKKYDQDHISFYALKSHIMWKNNKLFDAQKLSEKVIDECPVSFPICYYILAEISYQYKDYVNCSKYLKKSFYLWN